MSKLNKSQIWEMVQEEITLTTEANVNVFKKDQAPEFGALMIAVLSRVLAPTVKTSDKINADGMVYCNYFEDYYAGDDFNTKTDGKYKANCKLAEQILRKLKTLKANVSKQATINLRDHTITQDEWFVMMDALDLKLANKYYDIESVPAVSDVIGL